MFKESFASRHIGPNDQDIAEMLRLLQVDSLDQLIDQVIPKSIRLEKKPQLPPPQTEPEFLETARKIASENKVARSFIGLGYYGTVTPPVILRNVLENPGWYTAYTPYQPEISQGRLEALLNFQTMISDLTAMEIANASLLDEATSAAEAMTMCLAAQTKTKKTKKFFVANDLFLQTIEVLKTRAEPLGIELVVGDPNSFSFGEDFFGSILQVPNLYGAVSDYEGWIQKAHAKNILVIVAADLLSLTLLKTPGEMGADVAVGSTQRFGVPMGFGGPHAAYFATRSEYKRLMPGRLVGVSKDAKGNRALRLALQTREQHIRREKATSNVCTAQVLLAVMASMYAVYHGPKGLKAIATQVHHWASLFAEGLRRGGYRLSENPFFDTVHVSLDKREKLEALLKAAVANGFNVRHDDSSVSLSFDETSTREDVETLWKLFGVAKIDDFKPVLPQKLLRNSKYLTHPVFNTYHSETEMLRYLFRLQGKDLTLTQSMIPLGSCTMKLNATTEMIPVTWKEFAGVHPFSPADQTRGYQKLIRQLESWLCEITGFDNVSLQPNAGSQGEYAGLLAIREYHKSRGETHRQVCLIPSSAHGTNPASAVMSGLHVLVVDCDVSGNVDIADLKKKAEAHSKDLAALMITYPSTHGVFEEGIREICAVIHRNGGQVYMDGANMNALVGLCRPGEFGPDVAHLNLHKTFCIPHGGGGPGVGPIGVKSHLSPYLPGHCQAQRADEGVDPGLLDGGRAGVSPFRSVSAAPWGSAGILPISWAYIALMGLEGLKKASEVAILNANYVAKRLEPYYPVLYKGKHGWVAHECIIDLRPLKKTSGVAVDDVAKRLMDFGFHAPTMSFPVVGTLMIEPTESESKEELDRFCEAMIAIRGEIKEIEEGKISAEDNVLKNAPHTVVDLTEAEWKHPYSREKAVFPLSWVRERKFWVSVGRIDNAYGDKNLICSCGPVED
ncbi:MAG: aminomethyl-transferring glycine dehydrogenase, partial [Deltaproteobacteria bacterium]|nr:aminomethyl-transferring glycine dehydrogenase [Deltaproteobacteria bacterium]